MVAFNRTNISFCQFILANNYLNDVENIIQPTILFKINTPKSPVTETSVSMTDQVLSVSTIES